MISRTLDFYFYFGTAVRFLQDARVGDRIADDADGGRRIRTNLSLVLAHLADLNLQVSLQSTAAQRLRELLQQFVSCADDAVLSEEQFRTLGDNVSELRSSLEDELGKVCAYSAEPHRDDLQALLDPAALFAPDLYAALPEIARLDIAAAGRCIAFELPTAAAFHLMRAVEALLQAFYASPAAARRRTDHTQLFERLTRIRTAFSNPLQHPQVVFSNSDAQQLRLLALELMERMAPSLTPAEARSGT